MSGTHDPRCFQVMGIPKDLPQDICDCRVFEMLDAATPEQIKEWAREPKVVEAVQESLEKERRRWIR